VRRCVAVSEADGPLAEHSGHPRRHDADCPAGHPLRRSAPLVRSGRRGARNWSTRPRGCLSIGALFLAAPLRKGLFCTDAVR